MSAEECRVTFIAGGSEIGCRLHAGHDGDHEVNDSVTFTTAWAEQTHANNNPSAEDVGAVAEVLATHAWEWWKCSCGTIAEEVDPIGDLSIEDCHLANVLAAHVAAAKGEALREFADRADSEGHHWSGTAAHAFFALATDARDCADRIEGGRAG